MRRTIRRRGAVQLAGRLMVGALVGKALGFAREIEMARLLGASYVADSFRASITATLLPIAMLQGDVVPSVLIPLHRRWATEGTAPLRFTLLTLMFGAVALPIMLATWVLADRWVGLMVAGFGAQAHALTVHFVQVMALAMPGSVLASCFSCIEISLGRSRVATIRASVQNVAVMGGIGLMVLTGNVILIGWAFTASMTATALYGGLMLAWEGELRLGGASLAEAWLVLREFALRVRAMLITPFADQANILLERMLVSGVGVGAVASMEYARTVTDTVLFLVSQPIGFVVLAQAVGDRDATRARVEALLRPLLALSMPAALFIVLFSGDIVTVVLRRGAFQEHAVALTSAAMSGVGVGLWAMTVGTVLVRMLNAARRNRTAAMLLLAAAAGQAIVNLAAVRWIGVMGAGLGDSARGIVMLIGAALALHCGPLLLRLLLRMVIPLAGFLAMGLGVQRMVALPLARLALGGGAFGVGIILCLAILAPEFIHRLRPRLVRTGA